MIPKKQTRKHTSIENIAGRGNCYAACIASILEMEVEDVLQIQEHYDDENWSALLQEWLADRGWEINTADEFRAFHEDGLPARENDLHDQHYFISGQSPRDSSISHITIWKNGLMVHDPHPDGTGILTHDYFTILRRIN